MAIGTVGALVAGGLASSAIGASASKSAGKATAGAAKNANQIQHRQYKQTVKRFKPFYEGGLSAFDALLAENGLGEGPEGYEGYQGSPMFDYLMNQGRADIEASAAARGSLFSGETMESLDDMRRGAVNMDYGRYYSQLRDLAGMGSMAAGNMGSAGANYANAAGANLMSAGRSAASARLGAAQSIQSGISDMAGIYGMSQGGYFNPMQQYAQSYM